MMIDAVIPIFLPFNDEKDQFYMHLPGSMCSLIKFPARLKF